MKHITEASDTDLANAIVGVGVQDTVAALRAAFDFSPPLSPERADARRRVDAALAVMSASQPAEGVAELIAELRKYADEFNYGDYSQKLVQRTIAALSASRRPTPSDEELRKVEADMRNEFVATADVLYFNGGYRTINRPMVERIARESSVVAALGKEEAE